MSYTHEKETRIILIRHGECQGNIESRFRGRKDYPLNERGRKQALELAKELETLAPDAIYSSPLKRAIETATPLAARFSKEIIKDEGFNNISFGQWEGLLKSEISKEYPDEWKTWLVAPEKLDMAGVEPMSSIRKRSIESLKRIEARHSGKTVVVVSHRTTLKPLLAAALSIPDPYFWKLHVDTASYSTLLYSKERGFCLYQLNQTKHLTELNVEWN